MVRAVAPVPAAPAGRWAAACIAVVIAIAPPGAASESMDEPPARALTGVLKRIKEAGAVRLAHRADAVPFAFTGRDGQPYGYSIDICHAIVEAIAEAVGVATLRVEYRRVTPADRIDQVADGRVDLECGATTNTAERRRRVAFSPLIFIAGTRLLVKRGSPVRSTRELAHRTVVVIRGTTNEDVMRRLAASPGRSFAVEAVEDSARALERLAAGKADAFAADDILIAGYLGEKGLRRNYAVVGDLISFEPYGIVFARDDSALVEAVNAAFRRLAATGEIRRIYNKWFLGSLPSGFRLALPMGVRLERSFQLLGLAPE
jgi:glutamate/aspartate transport system substrate-binding protein